ncbi:MAG TPA: alpha amylase C-terminal domain-containing protein [Urbifossiella sp.]|nr:alpha amylase C-terminal domain-containing protein [Urbifossiella sp.]
MGANLAPGGATFRVWAPDTDAVYVVLHDFDQSQLGHWTPNEADRLHRDDDGRWAGYFPGVTDGSPYRFWVVGKGGAGYKRDPYARELSLTGYPDCNCIVRARDTYPWHDAGFRAPPFNDLVIYQFHVGVYYAVDEHGKDIRKDRVSKFLDALGRLEYWAGLGINAVQPLPVVEWQGETSRGYNGTDYFSPEMDYCVAPGDLAPYLTRLNDLLRKKGLAELEEKHLRGQVNQLQAFIDLCHVYGIAVILDVVYNHAGPGFDDQNMRFFDRPANQMHWDGDSYFHAHREWAGGRIFRFDQDPVRQFFVDNAKMFVDDYHADGFRYDEVRVIHNNGGWECCRNLTGTLRYHDPSVLHLAEYWNDERWLALWSPPGGMGFDAELHDGLRNKVRDAVGAAAGGAGAAVDLNPVRDALRTPYNFPAAWKAVQHVENHDLVDGDHEPHEIEPRMPALAHDADRRSWYARSRSRVATGLVLTAPGIPMLFMGQEFLEDKPWHNNPKRSDLFLYWDGLRSEPAMQNFLRFTRELVWLRRRHPALRGEGVNPYYVHNDNRVLAVQRWVEGAGRDVVVVVSLREETWWGYDLGFPRPGHWHEVFNSDAYDSMPAGGGHNPWAAGNPWGVDAGGSPRDGMPCSARIVIPANAVLVFAQDRGD